MFTYLAMLVLVMNMGSSIFAADGSLLYENSNCKGHVIPVSDQRSNPGPPALGA